MVIGLVSCGAQKLDRAAAARDIYTSPLFRLSLAYAEAKCDKVYVLSARHHLLELDAVIQPYDQRLGGKAEKSRWASHVADSIAHRHSKDDELMVLAGADYARPLIAKLRQLDGYKCVDKTYDRWAWVGWRGKIEEPLEGFSMGTRLQWLSEHVAWLKRCPVCYSGPDFPCVTRGQVVTATHRERKVRA